MLCNQPATCSLAIYVTVACRIFCSLNFYLCHTPAFHGLDILAFNALLCIIPLVIYLTNVWVENLKVIILLLLLVLIGDLGLDICTSIFFCWLQDGNFACFNASLFLQGIYRLSNSILRFLEQLSQ